MMKLMPPTLAGNECFAQTLNLHLTNCKEKHFDIQETVTDTRLRHFVVVTCCYWALWFSAYNHHDCNCVTPAFE